MANSALDNLLKRKRCKKCGTINSKKDKFCKNCGANMLEDPTIRKQEFAGVILKCPSCGEVLSTFTAVCPACGHEITKSENESTIKKFSNKLSQIESGFTTNTKNKTEKKNQIEEKALFIKNYVFDNDRASIVEAMIYVSSQMTILNDLKIKEARYWATVWKSKAVELYNKAQVLFPNDKVVIDSYDNILAQFKKIKKKDQIRVFIIVAVVVVVVLISYLMGER